MRIMKKYMVRSQKNEVEFYTKRSALIHYNQLIEEIRQNGTFRLIHCEKNNYYIYEEKATKNRYSVELLTLR